MDGLLGKRKFLLLLKNKRENVEISIWLQSLPCIEVTASCPLNALLYIITSCDCPISPSNPPSSVI